MKDHLGVLWIGTFSGLNRYDAGTGNFTRFLHDPTDTTSLSDNGILTIYEDTDSNLWVGTTHGLNLLDRSTGKFTRYQKDDKNLSSIDGSDRVNAIAEDRKNYLWIGRSFNAGVDRLDKKTGKFKQYLSGQVVNDFYVDSGGVAWVGTEKGLYRYLETSDDFYSFSAESTGISMDSNVLTIVGDDEDNIWISSMAGIYKLNKNRDHLIHFGKEHGVIITDADRLVVGSGYKTSDGKIMFGDIDGYYRFDPNKLKTIPGESKLYFSSFWLNNREIKPSTGSLLQHPIDDTPQILLDHRQNIFAFSFTNINFRSSEDKVMSYTLENYDADWRQTGMGEKVNYFKVPPGEYSFRIKSFNSATGTKLEKSVDLIIAPP
jgi:ligand-binding sensor domain-containing protein